MPETTEILCCGEALIDMLPRRLETGEAVFLPVPGGAIFNTAIALGRLGEATGLLAGLSTDMFGEMLAATLEESRVDHSLRVRSPRPTTLAFVTLTDGQAQYAFHDDNSAGRMVRVEDLPSVLEAVGTLQFGATSLIAEPCGTAWETLALREAARRVIVLDPNVRPGFVADETAYRARLDRLFAIADIVRLSEEDLAWLVPGQRFEDVAGGWLSAAASLAVLTRGERGAVAMTRHDRFEVDAARAKVVDTVGAGDTFNAGLLAGLARAGLLDKAALRDVGPQQLRIALDLATRAAAVTVSRARANSPWSHEIGA